jgi:hypothetical protein
MYEDSPLRKCSTTTCCSNYTYVYKDFDLGSGGGSDGGPFGSGGGDWGPFGSGGGGSGGSGYGGGYGYGYGYDGGYDPPPSPPFFSGSSGGSTGGSGSGSSCTMTISTSGTFVGESRSFSETISKIRALLRITGIAWRLLLSPFLFTHLPILTMCLASSRLNRTIHTRRFSPL